MGRLKEIRRANRRDRKKIRFSIIFLAILWLAEAAGLIYKPTVDLAKEMFPFVILLSAVILFYFHRDWRSRFYNFMLVVLLIIMIIHLIGVHLGIVFGNYEFGKTLGIKVFKIPVIIGLFWLILMYTSGMIAYKMRVQKWKKAFFGALLVLVQDILLEPVAMRFDLWSWATVDVPLRNYFAWFIISFVILYFFYVAKFYKSNHVATALYIILLVFFSIINFYF